MSEKETVLDNGTSGGPAVATDKTIEGAGISDPLRRYTLVLLQALQQLLECVQQDDSRYMLRMLRSFKHLRKLAHPTAILEIGDRILWNAGQGTVCRETVDVSALDADGSAADSVRDFLFENESCKNYKDADFYPGTFEFWKNIRDVIVKVQERLDDAKMDMEISYNASKVGAEEVALKGLTLKPLAYRVCIPEVEALLATLFVVYLIDHKHHDLALRASSILVSRMDQCNRRTMDHIAAKAWFYHYRALELSNKTAGVRRKLMAAYRKASLHHDTMCQATLLNLLLRDYISNNHYEQALKLISQTNLPENLRSTAQHARYLYYIGSIQAVRLEYSAAFAKLQLAMRKAPQQPGIARGFRLAALKKAIVVELLMGDIPERSLFNHKNARKDLIPYRNIVLAVRGGDLHAFAAVMENNERKFLRDNTWFLIRRLHHNVIRAGLRIISVSYSCISLNDIAKKLGLEGPEDAECIVSKAILDGVIEVTVDHDKQLVQSKASVDIYASNEPQKTFHKRIAFCLDLYNDAVKAMQYPDTNGNQENKSEDAEERRKALQEEMARAEDDDMGDDLDMM